MEKRSLAYFFLFSHFIVCNSPHTMIHKGPEGVLTITVEVIRSFI